MEAQLEYVLIAYMFLHFWHRFVCSVGAYHNKISASELSQKFIKSAFLVGKTNKDRKKTFFSLLLFEVFNACFA